MTSNPSMAGLASLVQSRGRNGDSVLVHMTPDEVHGLHSLALAHGGQLTINPETGLYEANFLKKLLPTIIGFALAPLTAGTSLAFLGNPLVSGALVGGIEGLRTGDLGKGLMAGLGAFGGASLGAGLTAAAGTGAGAAGAGTSTAGLTGSELAKMGANDVLTNTIYGGLPETAAAASGAGAAGAAGAAGGAGSTFGTFGKGLQALGTQAGRSAFMGAVPGGTAGIAAGGMGIANAMTPDYEQPDLSTTIDPSYYESYGYDTGQGRFLGGQWRKNYPGFPRPPGMAGGGVIPAPNGNYPLAKPSQAGSNYEMSVDPYTGEERFAAGGAAFGRRKYEEMPADRQSLEPNSAKAGWMDYMRNNPEAQKPFLDAGYPAEFFQQDPNTFTGNRPFIPGKDEGTRESEQERLIKAGYSPSYFEQFRPSSASAAPQQAQSMQQAQQPQSLEAYYQSLLAPPVQQSGGNQGFADYMQNLNKYVTSPVAPPSAPKQPPAAGIAPPGAGGRPIAGGAYGGDGAMRWDANQGRFVSDAPRTPFSAGNMPTGSPFSGFGNIDFSALQNMFRGGAGASGGGMKWDADRGQFTADQPMTNQYDQFTGDMGQGMDQGSAGAPPQDQGQQQMPDFSGMDFSGLQNAGFNMSGIGGGGSYMPDVSQQYPPDMGQQYQPDMSQQYQQYQPDMYQQYQQPEAPTYNPMNDFSPEYAGGSPNYDMGNYPIQEFSGTPYMPEMYQQYQQPEAPTYNPMNDFSPEYAPQEYKPEMPYQPAQQAEMYPSPDSQFLAGLQSQGFGRTDTPAQETPFSVFNAAPPSSNIGGLAGLGALGGMQQQAPQPMPQPTPPPPDMGGFGGFSGGFDSDNMGMFAAGGPIQYAAGGKFLRGPGDGMSDDIKANINGEQEARLADGEFVIPADVVSHIGNGSSEAGADRLHVMMDRIRKARTGRTRQAPEIDSDKYLPA